MKPLTATAAEKRLQTIYAQSIDIVRVSNLRHYIRKCLQNEPDNLNRWIHGLELKPDSGAAYDEFENRQAWQNRIKL
jgi:hypothetical protein